MLRYYKSAKISIFDQADEKCFCLNRNLKLFVRMGMEITTLKRVIGFKSKQRMKNFLHRNTELRDTSTIEYVKFSTKG